MQGGTRWCNAGGLRQQSHLVLVLTCYFLLCCGGGGGGLHQTLPVVSAGFSSWFISYEPAELLQHEYDIMNDELVKFVDSDAAIDNILEALRWLKIRRGQVPLKPEGLKLPSKEALLKFTELLKLMDPDKPNCDLESHNILAENELATGSDIAVPMNEFHAHRRIEVVIQEVAYEHAIHCRPEYPYLFEAARKEQPAWLLDEIRSMLNAMIETSTRIVFESKTRVLDPRHVHALKALGVSVVGSKEARALLLELRTRSRHDQASRYLNILADPRRTNHWIVNEAKVVGLLNTYVFSRCKSLTEAFEHILKPAAYDQRLFGSGYRYRAINDATAELMIWLEYYRFCQAMTINKNKRKIESNIIHAIWEERY